MCSNLTFDMPLSASLTVMGSALRMSTSMLVTHHPVRVRIVSRPYDHDIVRCHRQRRWSKGKITPPEIPGENSGYHSACLRTLAPFKFLVRLVWPHPKAKSIDHVQIGMEEGTMVFVNKTRAYLL